MTCAIVFIATFVFIMCIACACNACASIVRDMRARRNVSHRLMTMHARTYRARDDIMSRERIGIR